MNRAIHFVCFTILCGCFCGLESLCAQSDPVLVVGTETGKSVFRIGERIPLELSFTSSSVNRYEVNLASYDRSGRLHSEQFDVNPTTGWKDPLAAYFANGYAGGEISSSVALSSTSQIIDLNLNEWVRFDQPGDYDVIVRSSRVSVPGKLSPVELLGRFRNYSGHSLNVSSGPLLRTLYRLQIAGLLELSRLMPWLLRVSYAFVPMLTLPFCFRQRRRLTSQILALLCSCTAMLAQGVVCPSRTNSTPDPAEVAFAHGYITGAQQLFQQELLRQPQDPQLIAGMTRTWLSLGKLQQAADTVQPALQSSPRSAPLLVALADVQLTEGQPWLAQESLDRAAEIDPCSVRLWLLRSKIDRLDSMHATERADVARAHTIDPSDPETLRMWNRIVTPSNDLMSAADYLRTAKNVDPELLKTVKESANTTLQLLSENTQTCKGYPDESGISLPLLPSLQDSRHINGYQLSVDFGAVKVALSLDTVASGFYINQSLADRSGLAHRLGDPANTVYAEKVQVGPLTFRDCVIGVSEIPFPNKVAGFMGTDLFAQYLIELNFPQAKLLLSPLPKVDALLPGDRPQSPELSSYSPIYHRLQYLLVPVTLNGKERRLFALDSGIRLSAISLPVAHSVNPTRHGFTSSVKTMSGATIQTYNDSFDLKFAHQQLRSHEGLLEFESDSIEKAAGMNIGGLIGLDILQEAVLSLDYRDGLIQVKLPASGDTLAPGRNGLLAMAGGSTTPPAACTRKLPQEVQSDLTIVASNTGMLDVRQLKAGQTIALRVERAWETDGCRLERAALIHGHVASVEPGHDPEPARLGFVFDRAECFGKREQTMPLRLISLAGGPDASSNIDQTLPTAVLSGGSRNINDAVATTHNGEFSFGEKSVPLKTGSVQGLPAVSLETAGPACSAVLTGSGSTLRLGAGTHWILVSVR